MEKLFLLSQISLFEELPMEELRTLDGMSEMRKFKKGTIIVRPGAQTDMLFLLKMGQVRLYRMNNDGKEFTVDILVDGNIFGEVSTLSLTDDQIYAEAMTDTVLCMISSKQFEQFIEHNPKIALKLINVLSSRLKEIYSLSEKIALSDVQFRLLFLLVKLSEKTGTRKKEWQTIELRITHQDLANMIGTTRETTSAIMGKLKKEGFIKKGLKLSVHIEKSQEALKKF